jgi:hypothetical protein
MRYLLVRKRDRSHEIREWSGDLKADKQAAKQSGEYVVCSHESQEKIQALKAKLDEICQG